MKINNFRSVKVNLSGLTITGTEVEPPGKVEKVFNNRSTFQEFFLRNEPDRKAQNIEHKPLPGEKGYNLDIKV
jgi:hypothetical protein